jgi:hypothetical protein
VKEFISFLKGEIAIHSEEGKGTEICFKLPNMIPNSGGDVQDLSLRKLSSISNSRKPLSVRENSPTVVSSLFLLILIRTCNNH